MKLRQTEDEIDQLLALKERRADLVTFAGDDLHAEGATSGLKT